MSKISIAALTIAMMFSIEACKEEFDSAASNESDAQTVMDYADLQDRLSS
jgi:hypothetical protein